LLSANYLPHRFCYLARPGLVWTNVVADGLIALSYALIFGSLLWIARRLWDVAEIHNYLMLFVAFAAFIVACGATHAMEIVTIWWPFYPLSAAVKVVCVAASIPTAIYIAVSAPRLASGIRDFIDNASLARRESDQAMRDNAAYIRALVDHAMDGVIAIDERGSIENFNPACERIFGYTCAEVFGRNIRMLMPEPFHSEHDGYLSRYVHTGQGHIIGTVGREVRGRRKDGSVFPMDLSVSSFYLADGRHFSGIVRDITERKRLEAERAEASASLAVASRGFRLLVEGVRDSALFTIDPSGVVASWNRGAERLTGYSEDQILGRNFACLFTPDDIVAGVPERQMSLARENGTADDEGWRIRANGERFCADVTKTAIFEDDGHLLGFAVLMRDVTERRRVSAAIEEGRQERERLQERFLSHVSHELRTPLTAIYFFATNVLDGIFGPVTGEQREQMLLILDNASQLKEMVNDLLDITRVETHKLTVCSQPGNAARLVAEVLSTCRNTAAAKEVLLGSELPPDLPFLWADPARVRQILTNLIDNAIKFTPDGGRVTLRAQRSDEDEGFLCLSVTDNGCGISPENRELIFDRLAQVKTNTEASRAGLGLGLYITRELVLRHGGRIWVESELGGGSTFFFTLPIFSLARWCSRVFTDPNLEAGGVTLIAVDMRALEGIVAEDLLHETRRDLARCIHPGQDVILPLMTPPGRQATIFIVACTGPNGVPVIEARMRRELQNSVNISRFQPIITSTTVYASPEQSPQERIAQIAGQIDDLIQQHLLHPDLASPQNPNNDLANKEQIQ
jgi:PAS domain S-box-containing protein